MSVDTLVQGIETRVQAVLGSAYVSLPFVEDVARNNFKGNVKGFGVLAGEIQQTIGVTTHATVSHQFIVKIADRWRPSQAGDLPKRQLIQSLQEKCFLIYKDLLVTKAGSPSEVINVTDGMYTETNLIDPDGVLEMRMYINLVYRKALNN